VEGEPGAAASRDERPRRLCRGRRPGGSDEPRRLGRRRRLDGRAPRARVPGADLIRAGYFELEVSRFSSLRTSSISTSWSGCFQRTFPSAERMTRPWLSNPSDLTIFLFSGVVASAFSPRTLPLYSASSPLTAGLIFAQMGQPGR